MFPRKLLLLIIDFLFKNKATVLAPAGSPISNTKIIDACRRRELTAVVWGTLSLSTKFKTQKQLFF